MKRILAGILCIGCFLALVCCTPSIKEYTGTPLLSLTFETLDYHGGYTRAYVFDFTNNVAKSRVYSPYDEQEPEFEIIAEFTDEQEKKLIDKLYTYGLFDIDDSYPEPPGIMDGGEWKLTIEYQDGATKESMGINNSPQAVFDDCAKAFYDICGDGIVGYVPQEYYTPPNVDYTFHTGNGNYGYSPYGERLDYKWNGFESTGNDIYDTNKNAERLIEFYAEEEYTLVLFTANYSTFNDYDKFKRCIVTSYDYNEELTNETTLYNGGWFRQIELDIELNKIYVVRLEFKNGDFVEYTFNTLVVSQN